MPPNGNDGSKRKTLFENVSVRTLRVVCEHGKHRSQDLFLRDLQGAVHIRE